MAGSSERFVWPPANSKTPPPFEPQGLIQRPPVPRWRAAILECERTWLGLTAPPLHERMAEANWSPDAPEAYCRRCGSSVGPHDADDTGCSVCRGKKLAWDRMVRLGEFSGLLRDLVLEIKFSRWRRLGDDLGRLMGAAVGRAAEDAGLPRGRTALVPMPISLRRRLSRGIDHSLVISRGISAVTGFPVVPALTRSHRPVQSRLPASQRRANIAGSIRAKPGIDLSGWWVIVVDDVTTTRATMAAACRAVKTSRKSLGDIDQAEVWGAVAGVTPDKKRG